MYLRLFDWLGPFGRKLIEWVPARDGAFPAAACVANGWSAVRVADRDGVETWEVAA